MYYSSAKTLENVIPLPQGGAKRREGFEALDLQRGDLSAVTITGYTYAAPNGGTAANIYSTSSKLTTTGTIGTDTEYVAVTIDAGSAVRLTLLDVAANLVGGTISLSSNSVVHTDTCLGEDGEEEEEDYQLLTWRPTARVEE